MTFEMFKGLICVALLLTYAVNIYYTWDEEGGVFWPIALGFAKTVIIAVSVGFLVAILAGIAAAFL